MKKKKGGKKNAQPGGAGVERASTRARGRPWWKGGIGSEKILIMHKVG